jgi:hypothetical protein
MGAMLTFARPGALPAVGSAAPMRRALAPLVATALLSAGCAPAVPVPPRPPTHIFLAAVAAPAPTPADPALSPETKSAPSEAHGGDAIPRAMGWFSLSFGAAAGIVAVGTSIMMLQQASMRSNDCNAAKVCSTAGLNANGQLDGLAGWNVASYIAAAAGIGIGTILLLTNPKNNRETALDVTPNASGAGLTLRSTF